MTTSVKFAPPNSIIFVGGSEDAEGPPPELKMESGFVSTPSCIVVGCFAAPDGETEITLEHASPSTAKTRPAFAGYLDTPDHRIVVSTVECEKVLELKVPKNRTRVRIWTNHPDQPNEVRIVAG